MIVFRKEHMDAFQKFRKDFFLKKLSEFLKNNYPNKIPYHDQNKLMEYCGNIAERSAKYGVSLEKDISSFAELDIKFGRNFEDAPAYFWISKILNDGTLTGSEKISMILQQI